MPHLSKKRWKSITSLSAKIKLVMIDVVQRSYPVSFGFFYQLLFLTLIPSQLITPMLPSNNLSKILYKNSCCSLFFFLFFRVLLTFDWMIGFKSWTQKRDNYCVIYIYIYICPTTLLLFRSSTHIGPNISNLPFSHELLRDVGIFHPTYISGHFQ